MLIPMAKQSTDDLAALLIFSSRTLVELPLENHSSFSDELFNSHHITLKATSIPNLQKLSINSPYIIFLKEALSKRLELKEIINIWVDKDKYLWVKIPTTSNYTLWFGFTNDRIGAQPSVVIIWVIFGGVIITILTSLLLVRRITSPLQRLYSATKAFANNQSITPVPETGPHELATLTRSFNQMTKQIHELMENRTTLLAGISHDLRTPITRMQLATEMLNKDEDPHLLGRIKTDLDEMTDLIQRTMEIAKGFDNASQETTSTDIAGVIEKLIEHYPSIRWNKSNTICRQDLNLVALRRVLTNILENALTYAGNRPIDIRCLNEDEFITVEVLDRGSGIPSDKIESVFQPFYRLEASRNRTTGGSGLGLAIVKQLCEANSWEIALLSRNGGGIIAQLKIPNISMVKKVDQERVKQKK